MKQIVFLLLCSSCLALLWAARAVAQEGEQAVATVTTPDPWPVYPLDDYFRRNAHSHTGGYYLSAWKLFGCWFLFLAWVRTADWLSRDAQLTRMNWQIFNPIVVGSFVLAMLLAFFVLPSFWFGMSLLLVAYLGPVGGYIMYRNRQVEPHERLLTPSHIRYLMARALRPLGVKIETETVAPQDRGPAVIMTARGADTAQQDDANLLLARQMPGFRGAKDLLMDILLHNADAAMLDFQQQQVGVRYLIDGVWHNNQPQPREAADPVLAVLKTIAALNPEERTARQDGELGAAFQEHDTVCEITTQGTKTGERCLLKFIAAESTIKSLEELGMRPKMVEQLKELLGADHGFLVFSSMPGGGLTTTFDASINSCDRFLREIVSIEDEAHPEHRIDNVEVVTWSSHAGETPMTVLPKVVRTQPNVLLVRPLADTETLKFLCEQAKEDQLVVGSIGAKSGPEALLRVLMLKVPIGAFASVVSGVVFQKLIRTLCSTCKEAYAPPPEIVKQLGLPPDKVEALYRPRQEADAICPDCRGIGYRGRTGLFEIVVLNDQIRETLKKTPKLDALRQTVREAGLPTVRDHGAVLVAKGETSVEELARVLKQ